jgi:hypothetical protein
VPRQQVRIQQRKIKAKQIEPPAPPRGSSRRLQARMLEGHSPSTVIRLSLYLALFQVALSILGVGLALLFHELVLKVLDVVVFLAAIVIPGTLVWPALILALRDRRATPELIQGQMIGASPVSMVYGLGFVQVNTRQGKVTANLERRLLRSIPQSQVQVALRLTPNLHHVESVQVIGPRLAGGVPSEVPEKFRFAERFPLIALAGTYGGVFGLGVILLLIPLNGSLLWLHTILIPAGMAGAAFAARFLTRFYQRRLEATLQP